MGVRSIVGSTGKGEEYSGGYAPNEDAVAKTGSCMRESLELPSSGVFREGDVSMRHMTLLTTGLATLTAIFASAAPAFAEYGSIAYDRTNCAWGRSWNYPGQSGADQRALSECAAQGSSCQVVAQVGPGQCGAVASTDSCSGYGWATRSSTNDAEIVALQQCRDYNPSLTCKIQVTVCASQ